jgi:hypothetical protein
MHSIIHKTVFRLLLMLSLGYPFFQENVLHAQSSVAVGLIAAPVGSLVPDVCMDTKGILHMVYAKNDNAWYMRSTDNGKTFSAAVQVNNTGIITSTMGERGPKISVGGDGVIHTVWADKWSAGVQVFARYARSLDGGKTFSDPKAVSATYGIDGLTVAADGQQHVAVFWHTMVPQQSPVPQATWLHKAVSFDNGATFNADTNVRITNHTGLACSMCTARARFGVDGKVYLVFRSAEDTVRDFYVLKGNVTENNFTAIRVNNDNWVLPTCPMVGPELTLAPDGRQLCAYMTRNKVYWSLSDATVNSFSLHVATPANETDEIYPSAFANSSGDVLFLWQVGPMSVSGTAVVKWALYSIDGAYTGRQGTVGTSFSGTKSTAFVGTDNNFYIVTNASIPSAVEREPQSADLSVYPNPAQDRITVRYASTGNRAVSWSLYSILGQKVMESGERVDASMDSETIDVGPLKRGVYLLCVQDGVRWSMTRIARR